MSQNRQKLPKFPKAAHKRLADVFNNCKKLGIAVLKVDCGQSSNDEESYTVYSVELDIKGESDITRLIECGCGWMSLYLVQYDDGYCIGTLTLSDVDNKVDGHYYAKHEDTYLGDGNDLKWIEQYVG